MQLSFVSEVLKHINYDSAKLRLYIWKTKKKNFIDLAKGHKIIIRESFFQKKTHQLLSITLDYDK